MSALLNHERQRTGRTRRPPQRHPILSPEQSKALVRIGFRTPGVLIAIIATVVVVTLVSVNSELTGIFGSIAGLWFAVHQVPVSISGTALGVFPLLPTLVLIAVIARGVSRTITDTSTRGECAAVFGAAVLGPILVTVVALAVAADASAAIGLASPRALVAFAWVGAVHAVGAAIGVLIGGWDSPSVAAYAPEWIRQLARPVVRATFALVAGGSTIVVVALVASWSTMEMLFDTGNGVVGMLGLTMLSILYLPNVIVGALAVAVGSTAHVGDVSVSMFGSVGGPLPPLPILAVLPESAGQSIWLAMLAVPIGAAVILGRDCARRSADIHYALSSVWLGAAAIGVGALAVGFAAGGNLGTFGTVQVTVWSFGLLVFAWVAAMGSAAAAITVWRGGSKEPVSAPVPAVEPAPTAALVVPKVRQKREVEAEVVEEPADIAESAAEPETEADVEEAPPSGVKVVAPAVSASGKRKTTKDLPDSASNSSD